MTTPKQEAKRRATGIACAKKLNAAADALRAYLQACNECRDASDSLSAQGKGRDGRETLIADLAEYASYLEGIYQ